MNISETMFRNDTAAMTRHQQQRAAALNQLFFLIVHQSIVMTFSIIGNMFLLFVIFRGNRVSRRRISPVQLLLLHTCAADLLFATLSLGTEILTLLTYPNYYGSDFICKLMRYCQMFPMYASPFLLVAISADRYQAICRPMAHFRSSRYRRPNWLAAIAWSLALLFSVPQFFVWSKKTPNGKCSTVYGSHRNSLKNLYVIWFNTFAWLLPSIFAAGFYYCVCTAVRTSSSKPTMEGVYQKGVEKPGTARSIATEDYIEELRKKSRGFRQQVSEFDRKRVQTVRLTIAIVGCNFFLWMPFCVINVIQALWPEVSNSIVISYVAILGNLNSCLNPWIYIFFNRSHVVKALCGTRSGCTDTSRKVSANKTEFTSTGNGNGRANGRLSTNNLQNKKLIRYHPVSGLKEGCSSVRSQAQIPRMTSDNCIPMTASNDPLIKMHRKSFPCQ